MLILHNVRKIPSNVMFWKPEIAGCLLMGTVPPQKKRGTLELPLSITEIVESWMVLTFKKKKKKSLK